MLAEARAKGYAVPAFNFENLEMAQAIISAAQSQRSPVILQTTPSTVKYMGLG
ncbi:MAG: class II fructose-bisphosphate aldolase, partial [Oscillospiraceae bacterium]|nr:class II fructose-bisphosphate aldolase [Oscillospiraceae bacterium]